MTSDTASAAQTRRLYLLDGSGYIFRAYHALPPLTRKSDGLPVGAQLVGRRFADLTCLAAAEVLEQAFGRITPIDPTW